MADLQNRLQEPRDTSPLELEQLSDDELATIVYIERRLYEAQHAEVSGDPKGPEGLARVQRRHPRVLLLDGGRGTGKTSMLLTLVERWHRGERRQDEFRKRIETLRRNPNFTHGDHDFETPDHVRVVGRILDFDPLPPKMPLVAGIIEVWRQLATTYDELADRRDDLDDDGETLMDLWHRLFRVAAVGWTAISPQRGLIEQVLDREEQVQDWQRLDEHWQSFIEEVIKRGQRLERPHRLATHPVFAIMIDDVDFQVERIRELLPALRLLYHRSVIFLVAADSRHMVAMLTLDMLGQQNKLANCEVGGNAREADYHDRWAANLAKSSFQKVFPLRNRWTLRPLSLRELLDFPSRTANLRTVLNAWPQEKRVSQPSLKLGDYLYELAVVAEKALELPQIMAYRAAHQLFTQVSSPSISGSDGLDALRHIIGTSGSEDLVRIRDQQGRERTLEYLLVGELAALFREELVEPISEHADIVASARPDFIYRRDSSSVALAMSSSGDTPIDFTATLVAVTLREDGYGVAASGLTWNVRLALAWTRVRMFDWLYQDPNFDLAFQWRFHVHPSPKRLLQRIQGWSELIRELHVNAAARPERIAYAWIYYHLLELGAVMDEVPKPIGTPYSSDSWDALLRSVPAVGSDEERTQWKTRTLPLLARPEIGLTPEVQKLLLQFVKDDAHAVPWLWDQRRRLVTDAILAAADEAGVVAQDAENQKRVEGAIGVFERRHRDSYQADSPWSRMVEEPVRRRRRAGTSLPEANS